MIDAYNLGRRGTNTGASTSALTDDADFGGQGGIDRLAPGCWVKIDTDTGGVAPQGEITRLASRPKLSTGTANLDPSITALANGDTFSVLYDGLCFDAGDGRSVDRAINDALARIPFERRVVPITMFNDGDMLAAGTTAWEGSGGGETIAKNVATFTYPYRYLSVADTGTSEYVTSVTTYVVEQGASYYYEVAAAKASAGDGAVQLRDVTNSENLTLTNTAIDERVPQLLINNVSMAATTEQVKPRITKSDSAGTQVTAIFWVIFRRNDARRFVLADRPQEILRIGQIRATTESVFSKRSWNTMREIGGEPVQTDAGIWEYHLDQTYPGVSLWYEEFVAPTAFTADSDTSYLPKEHVAAVATEILLRPLRMDKAWAASYDEAARDAHVVLNKYRSLKTTVDRRTRNATPAWA